MDRIWIFFFVGVLLILTSVLNGVLLIQDNSIESITIATTTSTDNSGLLSYFHPVITKDTGFNIDVIAVGTGAALELARGGLADVVIVHAQNLEDEFIQEGFGSHRVALMFNDFIIVGPTNDPAKIRGNSNTSEVFTLLYNSRENIEFVSRGDSSGTHVKELTQWELAGINIDNDNYSWAQENPWYLETGSGMGETLTVAWQLNAYTLTDRSTWLFNQYNAHNALEIIAEGSPEWLNRYSAILVNPDAFSTQIINFNSAKRYVQWLISGKGQSLIGNYTINDSQAFFPDFNNHIDEMTEEELEFWGIQPPTPILSVIPKINRRKRIINVI